MSLIQQPNKTNLLREQGPHGGGKVDPYWNFDLPFQNGRKKLIPFRLIVAQLCIYIVYIHLHPKATWNQKLSLWIIRKNNFLKPIKFLSFLPFEKYHSRFLGLTPQLKALKPHEQYLLYVILGDCWTFYHGKSTLNHTVGKYVLPFLGILSKSKYRGWTTTQLYGLYTYL